MSDQWYVRLPVETNAETMAEGARNRLRATWPGWEPNDSDLENIQIEVNAELVQNAAEVAARMPPAALIALGTKLFGVPYGTGAQAHTTVTITLTDTSTDHIIPQGYEIDIDGFAFAVDSDHLIVAGSSLTVPTVAVTATLKGEAQNGLTGTSVVPVGSLAFVASVVVDTATSGGSDAQSDVSYQSDFSLRLQLRAETLVVERDFELWALLTPGIGRAVAQNIGARNMQVTVTNDVDGEVAAPLVKAGLLADFIELGAANFNIAVLDATYTTVNISYVVKAYPFPGFSSADLISRINTQLAAFLSPLLWGTNTSGESIPGTWFNDPVVRRNKIIDLIGSVPGVDHVRGLTISGSAGTVDGTNQKDTADFTGTVTGGSYTWTIDGLPTAAINYNATNAQVLAAILALTNTEPGDLVITGGPGPTDYTIEWTGYYAYRPRTVSIASSVTGGGSVARVATQAAVPGSGDLTLPGTVVLARPGVFTGATF